ncbi:RNA polymerase sigma factor CnrH [Aquisphaera giovannonii]|uniref:RNA polymerase sigma factor CnrH n=1 Tax=Aquisphaera giovannonii TaxID=406548 RepID=A0A5B9VW12_9BACT|nr:sigma-70 family RNA polymerase sigma factor [Aquisphaera giovannonii]QEH32646.1 RNA polymerase sigma factor CnrH [Aquisphaera giovannonii]
MAEHDPRECERTIELLRQARDGDPDALENVFGRHRDELRRAVARRLDPALRGRIDPSDVVQEAHIEALERLPEFVARRPMPLRNWLLRTALQKLLKLRHHALAGRRDVARESRLAVGDGPGPGDDTVPIPSAGPSPSQEVATRERAARLGRALGELQPADRSILELRTYQGLSFAEVADRLGIEPAAARKRFGRALLRMRAILVADGLTESTL